jgi:gamma-aminobutyric acid receptor subunit beta
MPYAVLYIWKVILLLILIVAMSWTVFWIDPENIGIQISIAITSMLTLIAYRFAIDLVVPRVPYATRLDEFIFGGTALIFLSLVEVNVTSRLVHNGRKVLAEKIDGFSRVFFPLIFVIVVLKLTM